MSRTSGSPSRRPTTSAGGRHSPILHLVARAWRSSSTCSGRRSLLLAAARRTDLARARGGSGAVTSGRSRCRSCSRRWTRVGVLPVADAGMGARNGALLVLGGRAGCATPAWRQPWPAGQDFCGRRGGRRLRRATPFPGVAALVPAVGTAMVIAAGTAGPAAWPQPQRCSSPVRCSLRADLLLALPLALAGARLGAVSAAPLTLRAACNQVALAMASPRRPIAGSRTRFAAAVSSGALPRRNLSLAAVASVSLVVVAVGTGRMVTQRFVPVPSSPVTAVGDVVASPIPQTAGPIHRPRARSQLPRSPAVPSPARFRRSASRRTSRCRRLLPSLLSPLSLGPAAAPPADCGLNDPDTVSPSCLAGDPASATRVVLFGDSHAMQWFPAVDRIAVSDSGGSWSSSRRRARTRTSRCDLETRVHRMRHVAGEFLRPDRRRAPSPGDRGRQPSPDPRRHGRRPGPDARRRVRRSTVGGHWCPGRRPRRHAGCAIRPRRLPQPQPRPHHRVRGRPHRLFDDAWLTGERARAEAAEATFVDTASWLCPTSHARSCSGDTSSTATRTTSPCRSRGRSPRGSTRLSPRTDRQTAVRSAASVGRGAPAADAGSGAAASAASRRSRYGRARNPVRISRLRAAATPRARGDRGRSPCRCRRAPPPTER